MRHRIPLVSTLTVLLFASPGLAQQNEHELGEVDFPVSCNAEAQTQIETGVAQLHHMMYDRARPLFQAATKADPDCAMAWWGLAMTHFQPLWHPTSDAGLERGKAASQEARSIGAPTEREEGYIAAVHAFFSDPQTAAERSSQHEARVDAWRQAQRASHEAFPQDVDAAAFYALAEIAYAATQFSPEEEHDYSRERAAGALLGRYLEQHPEHPGLHHYSIHAYDSAELARRAEDVAGRYDDLAPFTPHALHMPSHTFVRLGRWEETVEWNERSAAAALENPVQGRTSLHYPHALDYMMYAHLQLGQDAKARETLERVRDIEDVQPDFAAAYGIAAAQARYHLEQRNWDEAAELEAGTPEALAWEEHPAAEALFHYARGLGAARAGDLEQAQAEADRIAARVDRLRDAGDAYWAHMTDALGKAVDAWARYERGDTEQALALMREAANLEESMDKHPVTPGEVLPVRELYGELLLREGRGEQAEAAFEASLERTPNRRNALEMLEGTMAAR